MNYRIIAILLLAMVIIGGASSLISGSISTFVEKENYNLLNEKVIEKEIVDKTVSTASLEEFKDYDFKGFDFKQSFTGETIFDDEAKMIYYVYSVTKPIAVYDKDGVLIGFKIQSMEIKQGHSYDRKEKCLAGEMPYVVEEVVLDDKGQPVLDEQNQPTTQNVSYNDENSCMYYGQILTTNSLTAKLKEEMNQLEKLKTTVKILVGDLTENYLYEKAVAELPEKEIIKDPIIIK